MSMVYAWGHAGRYNSYSAALRQRFSERVQKVSVDAGFTCPNRDGTLSSGGCTYCNNQTFNPDYCRAEGSIAAQLEEGIRLFSRKDSAVSFLAYFQAYSNTYAPLAQLQARYEEALLCPGVKGLVIGTRPDCINDEILDYLAELSRRCYVMVEYGVESICDESLQRVRRGHSFADSCRAIRQSAERGLSTGAHLLLGLPGETRELWLRAAAEMSALPIDHLKLHQLQIVRGTSMAHEYRVQSDAFALFTPDAYLELVVDFLEQLAPRIVVERFISESPKNLLIAPDWGGVRNYQFAHRVENRLRARGTWQGRLYNCSATQSGVNTCAP